MANPLGWATLGANVLGGLFGGGSQSQDKTTSRATAGLATAKMLEAQPLRQRILALLGQNVGNNVPQRFTPWSGQQTGYDRSMFELPQNFQPDHTASNVYQTILEKLGYGSARKNAAIGRNIGEPLTQDQWNTLPISNTAWGKWGQ